MTFANVEAEVLQEFAGIQEVFWKAVDKEYYVATTNDKGMPALKDGFQLVRGAYPRLNRAAPMKTEARTQYHRAFRLKEDLEKIRAALLRGERPGSGKGKRGRPPVRWLAMAKELGIDITEAPANA